MRLIGRFLAQKADFSLFTPNNIWLKLEMLKNKIRGGTKTVKPIFRNYLPEVMPYTIGEKWCYFSHCRRVYRYQSYWQNVDGGV